MTLTRSSGVLAHPTSFSPASGIGTFGKAAYKFVDWLFAARQSLWQILPLGPTGYGDSPYASFSTFAGNPLLVDLDLLVQNGWALQKEVSPPSFIKKNGRVDFGSVVFWKNLALKKAANFFLKSGPKKDLASFEEFKKKERSWLENFSLFMSIKNFFDAEAAKKNTGGIWFDFWPKDLAAFEKSALLKWKGTHEDEIEVISAIQFFFDVQWKSLKNYANKKGVKIIGDIPIFVAQDSADVWSNQNFFQLQKGGRPKKVAGVPPDYFSATGQLWGNPLYDWSEMKKTGYSWWVWRIRRCLELCDIIRIDHFRGFESYWAVPFGEKTAVNGKWMAGPGSAFFKKIRESFGSIPIIAEDLGLITKEVQALREEFGFPGMKILQFAFDESGKKSGMKNQYLPHNYEKNCVVYTGTHDNDTLQGWISAAPLEQAKLAAEYALCRPLSKSQVLQAAKSKTLCDALIKAAFFSCAKIAIIPVQDVLGLGSEGRMNSPSTVGSNWSWRFDVKELSATLAKRLAFFSEMSGRASD